MAKKRSGEKMEENKGLETEKRLDEIDYSFSFSPFFCYVRKNPFGNWWRFVLMRTVTIRKKSPNQKRGVTSSVQQCIHFEWNGEYFSIGINRFNKKFFFNSILPSEIWDAIYKIMASFPIKGNENMEQMFYDVWSIYKGNDRCYLEPETEEVES